MIQSIRSVIDTLQGKLGKDGDKIKIVRSYKNDIQEVISQLEKFHQHKSIKDLIRVLKEKILDTKSSTLSKRSKDAILELIHQLSNMTEEQLSEEQEDEIQDLIQEIEEETLEQELDMECQRYNKFNQQRPAPHISYRQDRNQFRLQYPSEMNKLEKKSTDLNLLVQLVKEEIFWPNFGQNLNEIRPTKQILYNNRKIIIYKHPDTNEPLYDINHVICLCTNSESTNPENEYKRNKHRIKFRSYKDNAYGGFYVKEFISQEDFYEMILHSTTQFSQRFKQELSKILDKWTNEGIFTMENNQLTTANVVLVQPNDPFHIDPETHDFVQTYENLDLVNLIQQLVTDHHKQNWGKFLNQNLMYMFLVLCKDPLGKNRPIVKIGFTSDLVQRLKRIKADFSCNVYVLGLKFVRCERDEKEFHTRLQQQFPHFHVPFNNRQEFYVFDPDLWRQFYCFNDEPFTPNLDQTMVLEEESQAFLDDYFGNLEERIESDLSQRTMIQFQFIQNEHQQKVADRMVQMWENLSSLRMIARMDEKSRQIHLINNMSEERLKYLPIVFNQT